MENKKIILAKLKEFEIENDIKIIFAAESGSRSWGWNKNRAPNVCRFIYMRRKNWYVSLFEKQDTIEYQPDENIYICGWDIKKAMLLILRSDTSILEWLRSRRPYICYEQAFNQIQNSCNLYFDTQEVLQHYRKVAKNHIRQIADDGSATFKHYAFLLRIILNIEHVKRFSLMPEPNILSLMKKLSVDKESFDEANLLLSEGEDVLVRNNSSRLFKYMAETFVKDSSEEQEYIPKEPKNYSEADKILNNILELNW